MFTKDSADSGHHVPNQCYRPWLDVVTHIFNTSTGRKDPKNHCGLHTIPLPQNQKQQTRSHPDQNKTKPPSSGIGRRHSCSLTWLLLWTHSSSTEGCGQAPTDGSPKPASLMTCMYEYRMSTKPSSESLPPLACLSAALSAGAAVWCGGSP